MLTDLTHDQFSAVIKALRALPIDFLFEPGQVVLVADRWPPYSTRSRCYDLSIDLATISEVHEDSCIVTVKNANAGLTFIEVSHSEILQVVSF
jgi:hypothetical protein